MKLVVDTNILVSGLLWSGAPSRLIDALERRQATLVMSGDLLAEFKDVIARPKFAARLAFRNLTPAEIADLVAATAEFVQPAALTPPVDLRDPNDFVVLTAAVGGHAQAIVTGDNDLLTLKGFMGIPILSIQSTLQLPGLS